MDKLEYVLTIAKERNLTRAAEKLYKENNYGLRKRSNE